MLTHLGGKPLKGSAIMPHAPKQKISPEHLASIFSYDARTGKLFWKVAPKQSKVRVGDVAGSLKSSGYIRVQYKGQLLSIHRVAWALHYGKWPSAFIDHKNRDRSDNRIENLRECSHAENMRNRPKAYSNKSGLKGVWSEDGVFRASIAVNGKVIKLGRFRTAEEGHLAYCEAAKRLHKEFASF